MKKILAVLLLTLFGANVKGQNSPTAPPAYCNCQTGPLYKIQNKLTGYILEIPANPNQDALEREGTVCSERSDMGSANQQWYIKGDISSNTGTAYILNRNSNQLLTGPYDKVYQTKQKYDVSSNPIQDSSQEWNFIKVTDANGNISYAIRNRYSHLLMVPNSSSENARISVQNFSIYDAIAQWNLLDITSTTAGGNPALFPGTYKITNINSGLTLQVISQSAEPGARIEQGKYIGIASQQWQLIEQPDPRGGVKGFAIINRLSGLALQVVGQSTTDTAPIEQGKFIGINSQLWLANAESGNQLTFTFQNVNSGYVMQVIGQSKSEGAQMQQGGRVPIGSQLWQLEYVAPNRVALATTPSVIENTSLTVYPNPASKELRLSPIAGETFTEASARNIQGQLVSKIPFKAPNTLDVSMLTPGIYLLTVTNNSTGTILHRKFVKN